jgi:hypothetical protein
VHSAILWTVVGASLLLAVIGGLVSALNRRADRVLLVACGVVELVTVVQSVVAGIGLAGGHQVHSAATFIAYLVGNAVVIPFALAWAWADRNRWSGTVIAVGGLTVAVMTARLLQMWQGRA